LGQILRRWSLLQIDQLLRIDEIKEFLGSKRDMVASDSEIPRALGLIAKDELRNLNYLFYGLAKQKGLLHLKDPLIADLRIGVIDGSCFGLFWAVVCEFLSDPPIFLDLEPIAKKGNELTGAKMLNQRITERLGKKWADVLLYDGLYVAQDNINQNLADGIDVLIKTDEVGLNIIEDAEGIFNHWTEYPETVEHCTGVDEARLVSYEIWAAKGFAFAGVAQPFKVARVKEKHLKTGAETVFWILTTREDLSGLQMRELAHRRWSIENNGFKQLNEQVNSKRIWTHDEKVWGQLIWIQMMAANLMGLFTAWLKKNEVNLKRKTRGEISLLLFVSLIREVAKGNITGN
jgi:hypothetical protein